MSNFNNEQLNKVQRKVISIKDLSEIKNMKDIAYKAEAESEQWDMQDQIARTKQEIVSLQEKKTVLLDQIKTAIEKEKETWLTTKEQEREEARQIGYKVGYDAGEEEAQNAYAQKLIEINNMTKMANTDYYQTIAKHEKTIIQLAIATAEKILQQKIIEEDHCIIDIVRQGIIDLKDQSEISIYVAPANYVLVMNRKDELEQLLAEGKILSIYINEQMGEGDCLIKHAFGQVDVGIDVQLQQIKTALEEQVTENS